MSSCGRGPCSPRASRRWPSDRRFPTPSGRIELWSDEARSRWGQDELPSWREPEERPDPGGPFPLHLLTPNTKNRIHSQFGNLETIRRMEPAPTVAMHPADAQARGLGAGDRARVFNARDELRLPVRFDWGLKPGCIAITNGFWISEGGAVNLLSQGRETAWASAPPSMTTRSRFITYETAGSEATANR